MIGNMMETWHVVTDPANAERIAAAWAEGHNIRMVLAAFAWTLAGLT